LTDAERFLAGENPLNNTGSYPSSSPKFYAVKSGRTPGIYNDWPSAQEQITGWTKPRHKCFATRVEAQRFLNEEEPKSTDTPDTYSGEQDYSVMSDGFDRPVEAMFKSVVTKKPKRTINGRNAKTPYREYNEKDYEAGTGPLPPGMEDGFDSNIILDPETGQVVYKTEEHRQATKIQRLSGAQTDTLRIHTDGSALGNGGPGAFAGVGVYFGPSDPRYS
jgi:ribonuclease HI